MERLIEKPPVGFAGRNALTPSVFGYFRTNMGGRTVYIELSQEDPPYWERVVERRPNPRPLIGVTYRRADGCRLEPDPSRVVHGRREAEEVLGLPRGSLGGDN